MTQTKAELLETKHQGDIRLGDANSSHYVGFKAPATVGSNLVWTLPATDGSANQFLQTNASGVLGWGTADVSSAMPLTGGTFTGNVTYNDGVEARFGAGTDLKIYHSSSDNNSYIHEAGSGHLVIKADDLYLQNAAATQTNIFAGNAVELKFGGNTKIATTNTGVAITGAATVSTDLTVTGDLTVSGTTTTINTQTLDVEDKNVVIGKVSSPSDTTADGGGWTLKGATDKTFNWVNATDAWTSSEHIHILDTKKLILGGASGTTDGLEIYHSSAHSFITNSGTGNLYIKDAGFIRMQTDNFVLQSGDANYTLLSAINGGACELYHNNSKKLETTTGGINVTGAINVNGSALTSGIAAEFTATADGAITANDPLSITSAGKLKKSGEITKPFNFSFTSDTQATTSNTERFDCMADPHNSNRWAIVYTKDEHQNRNPRLRIITRSGSTLTTSSEYVAYGTTGTSAASQHGYNRVFWDVNRANRVCVVTSGEYSRTYASLIEISGSAGSESFSKIVNSMQVSNEIGYYNQIYNGDPQIKHVGTADNYLYVWKTSSGTSKYSIIRLLASSIQVPTAQTAFWSEPCDNPPAFDMDPDNSGKGMATIVRNDSQSGTWYCRGFTVQNVNATDNSVSVNMHGPEGYVTSSSQTYDVDREYGSQIRSVATGHYVLSAFTASNNHGDNANRYKTIMKGIKWDGANTYTKSSPYYYMPSQITNSAPNRYNHKLFNKPSDLTTIVVTEGWDGNSQNLVGYRVAVNTTANTLSFSSSSDSGFARGSTQAGDMADEDNSTILWFREINTANSSFRAIRGGGPGDDLNSFVGFATATVSDGNSVTAKTTGNTATQSGLTIGSIYYLQRNGTISEEAATPEVKVGVALSATSILVK